MIHITTHSIPRHLALMLVASAVLAGCADSPAVSTTSGEASPTSAAMSPSSSPTATATPEPSVLAGCVNPPSDVTTLIDAAQSEALDVLDCYGNAPVTFAARWAGGGIADCPTQPEPAWLACSAFSLQPVGNTQKVGVPTLYVAIDPAMDSLPQPGTDVQVTGHFDDALAQTCHNTSALPDSSPEPEAEVIERCRRQFVITDITEY